MHHIGILGGGGISDTHARAAAAIPDVRVAAVYGGNPDKVAALAARHDATPYTDLSAFLAHRPMDIVAIGSPSGLHGEQGELAARAGLHLLIEKPIDVTVARADALIQAAERAGVQIAVCFQDRSNPQLGRVKTWIDEGRIGRPTLVSARVKWYRPSEYYTQSRWRGTRSLDGGGALVNQGIHTVDLLLWWLGDIVRVSARATTALHRIEVEDTLVAWLEFANGAIGTLEATTAAYPGYPRRVEVTGTAGTIAIEHDRIVSCDVRELPPDWQNESPAAGDTNASAASPIVSDARGHQRILEDLLDALRDGRRPRVDGREGRRSVAVVEAIYASARADGRPVEVDR